MSMIRSRSFETKLRLEIGRKGLRSDGSKVVFLSRGLADDGGFLSLWEFVLRDGRITHHSDDWRNGVTDVLE